MQVPTRQQQKQDTDPFLLENNYAEEVTLLFEVLVFTPSSEKALCPRSKSTSVYL